MALLAALDALSIDSMLPALGLIGQELGAAGNATQLVVSLFFVGMAVGQLFAGPLSDSFGRKPTIYFFIAVFLVGSGLSIFATDFFEMLLGRLLQGFGAAGPYVVTIAIVRDRFSGEAMARVMSFILGVFIFVPIVAPLFGQAILMVFDWRAIFSMLLFFAIAVLLWFALRQPETLPVQNRRPFSAGEIGRGLIGICCNRQVMTYTVIYGQTFGAFLGYLSSAQRIFQDLYDLGAAFPVVLALLSLGIGIAAMVNGTLVLRFGMRRLCALALIGLGGVSLAFLLWSLSFGGVPSLWSLMIYFAAAVLCFGLLFGNLSSLALEPLADQAGTGATLFGALSMMIALVIGTLIGQSFNMTILPLATGFALSSFLSLVLMRHGERAQLVFGPSRDR